MKKMCCVKLVAVSTGLLCAHVSKAQSYPRINFDLSIFRYGSEQCLDHNKAYNGILHIVNAVKLGAQIGKRQVVHGGLRRQPSDYVEKLEGIQMRKVSLSNQGFEATLGYEYEIGLTPFLSFLPEAGLFYDYAKMTGVVYDNGWKGYEVNHRRHFKGIYPEVKLAFRLSQHLCLMAGARLRAGYVSTSMPYRITSGPAYAPTTGYTAICDPVSTIAFRYQF